LNQQRPSTIVIINKPYNRIMTVRRRIPILDIAKYESNRSAFVEELRAACHTVGFFLIRHDFGNLAKSMLDETKSFFEHPLEDKLNISYENSPSFRGFMQLGVENTSGNVDFREQIEYAVEYKNSNSKSRSFPVYERLKAGKNPWPTKLQPCLESTTLKYSAEVCAVADIIRDSLCLALQLDPKDAIHDKFNCCHHNRCSTSISRHTTNDYNDDEVPHWVIKLVSYPPAPSLLDRKSNDGKESEKYPQQQQQGVGAHTDTNFLTLVLQDSSSTNDYNGGLQAYSQEEWIDVVVPSSSTVDDTTEADSNNDNGYRSDSSNLDSSSSYLICNLGEQAETWSRGYFLATPHRVIMKSSTKSSSSSRARTSVPLFYNPILSATMGPLDKDLLRNTHLVPWERPRGYDNWRRPNNLMNPSVGENTFKSLARSHPKVFARHHPDLEILEDGRIVTRS
jgi:isopenicillin N synthase-like dioxygenase